MTKIEKLISEIPTPAQAMETHKRIVEAADKKDMLASRGKAFKLLKIVVKGLKKSGKVSYCQCNDLNNLGYSYHVREFVEDALGQAGWECSWNYDLLILSGAKL